MTRYATISAIICALFLASCANTVRGVSADVKDTANAVEDAVE
ncbi:MAG: entericidin EcnAB [Rhizobiaceae bacterium]